MYKRQSQAHLNSLLEFNLLGKVDIRQQLDSAYRRNVKEHNEKDVYKRQDERDW